MAVRKSCIPDPCKIYVLPNKRLYKKFENTMTYTFASNEDITLKF